MSTRATALADQFEQANEDFIALVERLPGDHWGATCTGEGWSVAVAAHHVAEAHGAVSALIRAIADGGPLPAYFAGTRDELDRANAEHAAANARCERGETVALLRRNGADAAALVRGLDGAQLDRTAAIPALGGRVLSPQQVIERILIGHIGGHKASIQAAQGASTTA